MVRGGSIGLLARRRIGGGRCMRRLSHTVGGILDTVVVNDRSSNFSSTAPRTGRCGWEIPPLHPDRGRRSGRNDVSGL